MCTEMMCTFEFEFLFRSVDHPAVPICRNIVRVQDYDSQAVMQPHTTTNEVIYEYIYCMPTTTIICRRYVSVKNVMRRHPNRF